MQLKSDAQLLRDYAERGSETAFTELVQRHTNLVYSAALRQVESSSVAEELTQSVFVSLARGAKPLSQTIADEASLAGWLCRSARNLSLNHRRDEFRRQTRERQAMEQLLATLDSAPDWEKLRRVLDEAMSDLNETDYDAIVLRFFQNQDFRAVGAALGVSDDTAQKKVARAIDKLRDLLAQRGIRTTAAALSLAITANAIQAAPVGLALTISTAALAGTAAATSTVVAATTKAIAMTTLQKTFIVTTMAVLTGAGIYEACQTKQLGDLVKTLQQQQAPLTEQIQQLKSEQEEASNRIVLLTTALVNSKQDNTELLKLRAESGTLRAQLAAAQNRTSGPQQPPLATAREYYNRAGTHYLNNDYKKQLEDLDKAIELDPGMAEAYFMRGNLYAHSLPKERGGEAKALADYTRCLELKPNDSGGRWNRAIEYTSLGRHAEAIADWTTYIEGDTDFSHQMEGRTKSIAAAYFSRGRTYQYYLHDYSKAVSDYTAALQLNPDTEDAHRFRGRCYELLGDSEKAQQDFAIEPKRN